MRKVLQRTPSSGTVLFAAPANAYPPLSLLSCCSVPCHKPKPSFPLSAQARGLVSVGSVVNRGNSPRTGIISRDSLVCSTLRSLDVIAMPASSAAAAFDFRSCVSRSVNSTLRLSERQFVVVAKSCRISPRSINGVGCGIVVARPWVVLKEIHDGTSRFAWLHTAAGGEDDSISTVEVEGVSGLLDDGCESQREEEGEREDVSKAENADEKPSKFSRRRRAGGNNQGTVLQESVDLLTIPGVGPRNLRKLVQKGIGKVAELKQLYRDKFLGESNQKMVEYLQGSVGIIHRNHAESITTFIKESVDDDEESEDGGGSRVGFPKERITLCVEGNISVGKTTFLQRIANETLELQDLVEIVPEPIDKWQNVGPDHLNILDAFYADPQRYAYTFQNYVFVTRVMQERDSSSGIKPLRLMERSVFSDRMVFVRAVHEAKWMNEMEISIYDSWFDPVVSSLPGLIPDGFIYLRASPDTCHKRMMLRKREEEGGVSLDYLRGLHEKHESWLFPFESGNHGVLSVNQLPLPLDGSLHPDIKDRVFYLEGSHMHASIQKVPALILDCEPTIDFNRDIEAKRHYAKQVAEFFAFVKKKKELDSPKPGDKGPPGSKGGPNNPTVAPSRGLWLPDGKQLLNMPFQSLDFSQAMSFV